MSSKLNDTQLVLLSAASQRDDHCLVPPAGPKRAQSQRAVAKLLGAGLRGDFATFAQFEREITGERIRAARPHRHPDQKPSPKDGLQYLFWVDGEAWAKTLIAFGPGSGR